MRKKWLMVCIVVLMLSSLAMGCTSKDDGKKEQNVVETKTPTSQPSDETKQENVNVSIYAYDFHKYDKMDNDSIIKELDKKFNVSISRAGAPWEGYLEKLSLKINTGEAPDMFFYLTTLPEYSSWASNGVILELDKYMDKAPNLKKLLETDLYKNLKINGHYYFLPQINLSVSHSLYYRKDWLDKLQLKEPTNIEEFTAMIKAFTENDPDGNNKKDTVGLTASKISEWFDVIRTGFGVKPSWNKNEAGEYEPGYAAESFKQFLKWMNENYKAGYIQREYFLNDDAQKGESFASGKAGVMISNSGLNADGIIEQVHAVNPNAVIDVLPPPDGPGGQGGIESTGGFWGGWSISSQTKDPERVVQLLDYIYSPEGRALTMYGIEGIHYSKDGDKIVANVENRKKEPKNTFVGEELKGPYNIGQYFGNIFRFNGNKIEAITDNSFNKNPEIADKQDGFMNKNLILSDISNVLGFPMEFEEINKKMIDISERYSIMIISGEKTLDAGWSEMISEMNKVGFKKAQQYVKETMDNLK
ncbi:extracellular solute-binding protein [Paenibacillus eucommiae]|uniref:ABC-type glycerol-3-phosphate transport system substrate-binding protein n=1 Tax=Paenibacillus eucommiae TaxID=1355755 RepID=A0ABS4IPF6_9BACL|nr:extracellular solute-binding protein [Paenibacillus eucommiae]MBP1989451.1 ABC-type glycerol-3-phosphate transport system substrate-binding protein [Paenibacillus eucommiae]